MEQGKFQDNLRGSHKKHVNQRDIIYYYHINGNW